MKRYSHIAIVTIPTGSLVKGEWMAGEPMEIELKGQYYPSRDSGGGVKKNMAPKPYSRNEASCTV